MTSTILIAGATGSTGNAAVRLLLERGFSVRAFVHQEDERSRKLSSDGAEVAVGDLLDFRAVQRALDGIQRAYFVYPIKPGLVQATVQFAQAAREAGLDFIVNMSQKSSRPDSKSDAALQHWIAEQVFNWAGTPVAHLRPTYFAEWLLYTRAMLREGRLSIPLGATGRHAPVAAEDQAAVIAAILADPTHHAGKVYPLFGPVELTSPEIATIIGQTLGKEIRYEQVPAAQFVKDMTGQDMPFLAQHLHEVSIDHHDGVFAGTNDLIETIGGRSPMTVAQFVEKHRAAFG